VVATDADAVEGLAHLGGQVAQLTFVPSTVSADFDSMMDVDQTDMAIFEACATVPGLVYHAADLPGGCTAPADDEGFIDADFDRDRDVDQSDSPFSSDATAARAAGRPELHRIAS